MDHDNIFEIAFNAKADKYGDEDLLTDLFAWYLRQDPEIAIQLVKLLTGITPSKIKRIETQPTFKAFPRDFPDMTIVTPEMVVICEHKVSSPLGNRQLERYLGIAVSEQESRNIPHYLVFIARDLVMVSSEVYSKSHYRQGPKAVHFRWKDIYCLIQENLSTDHPLHERRLQFLDCLRYLKLAFLDPTGDFNLLFSGDPELKEEKQLQEKSFGEVWKTIDGTVAWFEERGFRPDYGSRKELYLEPKANTKITSEHGLKHFHISPTDGKGMPKEAGFQPPCLRFFVHFNKDSPEVITRMITNTPNKLETLELPVVLKATSPTSGPVQFWLPLTPFLEAASLSDSLRDVVTEIYQKVIFPAFSEM